MLPPESDEHGRCTRGTRRAADRHTAAGVCLRAWWQTWRRSALVRRARMQAINLCPEMPTYLLNRAATHFMCGSYDACIDDCNSALALDPASVKASVHGCPHRTAPHRAAAACRMPFGHPYPLGISCAACIAALHSLCAVLMRALRLQCSVVRRFSCTARPCGRRISGWPRRSSRRATLRRRSVGPSERRPFNRSASPARLRG